DVLAGVEGLEVIAANEPRNEDRMRSVAGFLLPHHPRNGRLTGRQGTGGDARVQGVGESVEVQRARVLVLGRRCTRAEFVRARIIEDVRPRGAAADRDPLEAAVRARVRDRLGGEDHLVAAEPRDLGLPFLVPDRPDDLVVLPGEGDVGLDAGARRVDVQARVHRVVRRRRLRRGEALEPALKRLAKMFVGRAVHTIGLPPVHTPPWPPKLRFGSYHATHGTVRPAPAKSIDGASASTVGSMLSDAGEPWVTHWPFLKAR